MDITSTKIAVLRSQLLLLLDDERTMEWVDFHPEEICHKCGGVNIPSWWVDSDRFNLVMGPPSEHKYNGIVCPGCFVVMHEEATGLRCTWMLVPDSTTTFRPKGDV